MSASTEEGHVVEQDGAVEAAVEVAELVGPAACTVEMGQPPKCAHNDSGGSVSAVAKEQKYGLSCHGTFHLSME